MRLCEDLHGFARLWERICKARLLDLQGFVRLWERIRKDFETLGEDLQGGLWILKDS